MQEDTVNGCSNIVEENKWNEIDNYSFKELLTPAEININDYK